MWLLKFQPNSNNWGLWSNWNLSENCLFWLWLQWFWHHNDPNLTIVISLTSKTRQAAKRVNIVRYIRSFIYQGFLIIRSWIISRLLQAKRAVHVTNYEKGTSSIIRVRLRGGWDNCERLRCGKTQKCERLCVVTVFSCMVCWWFS